MSYESEAFWTKYEEYRKETWEQHKNIVRRFNLIPHTLLDLGCGRTLSAMRMFEPICYIGLDKEPASVKDVYGYNMDQYRTDILDYRDLESVQKYLKTKYELYGYYGFEPTLVTSFFSSELTAPQHENATFYRELFKRIPTLKNILVSGFYYSRKRNAPVVEEVGGLISHQTIGDLDYDLPETRILERVPSTLFGPDVVEVWRLLKRPA